MRRGEDPETKQLGPPLPLVPVPAGIMSRLLEGGREVLIPKKQYDPFTNPNTETMLDTLHPEEILLFGVATDICDDAAARARSSVAAAGSRPSRTRRAESTSRVSPPDARPESASRPPRRRLPRSVKGCVPRCR